jgi:hypothetical protein
MLPVHEAAGKIAAPGPEIKRLRLGRPGNASIQLPLRKRHPFVGDLVQQVGEFHDGLWLKS